MSWLWTLVLTVILSVKMVTLEETVAKEEDDDDDDDFGGNLITQLKNDANLDLSIDEEYEDLRAELLAYHTTLSKLATSATRRSNRNNPCWQLGGICINYKLCSGFQYLTEVKGCRNNLNVCCFTWNKYRVKDMSSLGYTGLQYPWSGARDLPPGKGLIKEGSDKRKKKNNKEKKSKNKEKLNLKHNTDETDAEVKEDKTIANLRSLLNKVDPKSLQEDKISALTEVLSAMKTLPPKSSVKKEPPVLII